MRKRRSVFPPPYHVTLLALLLATAAGCASRHTYPVRGKVVFKDGTPLTSGLVRFRPAEANLQVTARGDIQKDGTFSLGTYHEEDGAVPGKYQVAITPPPRPKRRERPIGKLIIDPRFEDFETSGIEVEVAKRKNDFTIVVESPR